MAKERSTIELFFKALGHKDVQRALRSIAEDAARAEKEVQGLGSKAGSNNFANKLRADFQRAIKDAAYLQKEMSRIRALGDKGWIGRVEQQDLGRLKRDYAEVGRLLRGLNRYGRILNPNEQKDVERLSREFARLGQQIRQVSNAQPDFGAKKVERLRAQLQRLLRDQAYAQREINRLSRLGADDKLTSRDQRQLQKLRAELANVGRQLRQVKSEGRGLLNPNEMKDVERLREEWRRLAQQIRQVKNQQVDPNIALSAQLRQQLARAIKDQSFIRREIAGLSRTTQDRRLGRDERQYLAQLKAEYTQLGQVIAAINARGLNVLTANELKDAERLRRAYQELGKEIDQAGRRPFRVPTNIIGFLRAARTDLGNLFSYMRTAGGAAINFVLSGLRQIGVLAQSAIRNVGGLVPAFRTVAGAIRGAVGVARALGFQLLSAGFSAYALVRAFGQLQESNSNLESSVTTLRALNGELDKARGRAVFASDIAPQRAFGKGESVGGLMDINAAGARKTADELRYLNRVAYESGLNVNELTGGYVRLKASVAGTNVSIQDMQALFKGLAAANTVLGGTPDNAKRAVIALSQMASKGQVYAEELKGQLAEAIPGAVGLAARSYGMSVREFNKLVESGAVDSATFIKRFSVQLNKEYAQAAVAASKTTRIALGRMRSAYNDAKIAVASGKLDQVFMRTFNAFSRLLIALTQNGSFSRFGEKLSISLDKIVSRFERAVDGGYDFERVLNSVAKGFDFIVRTGEGAFDMLRGVSVAFRTIIDHLAYAGIRLPTVAEGLRSIGNGAREFSRILADGYTGENPFVNFLAAAFSVLREFVALLIGGSKDSAVSAVETLGDAFNRAAYFLGQLGIAINAFRTGKIDVGMDSLGEGLLVDLIVARDRILEIRRLMTGLQGLVTGQDGAPEGATGRMKRAYGYRDAVGRLFTGESNVDSKNPNAPYEAKNLKMLFQVRDILGDVFSWLIDNKAAIAAAFQGALDVVNGIADTVKTISDALSSVGIDVNVGYMLGSLFVLSKILGVMFLMKAAGVALVGAFTGAQLAMFGLIGALGVLTAYVYDRFGDQIAGGWDRVRSWFGDEEAGKRYEDTARIDQLAMMLRDTGNKQYRDLTDQGLKPLEAARQIQEQMDAREISLQSPRDLAAQQQALAREMIASNDNAAFGGPGQAQGQSGINNTVVIEIPGAGSFTVNPDGSVVDNLDPNVARARSGRPSSWAGVGR